MSSKAYTIQTVFYTPVVIHYTHITANDVFHKHKIFSHTFAQCYAGVHLSEQKGIFKRIEKLQSFRNEPENVYYCLFLGMAFVKHVTELLYFYSPLVVKEMWQVLKMFMFAANFTVGKYIVGFISMSIQR